MENNDLKIWKLKRVIADMWAFVAFINIETKEKFTFECENNEMMALLKASLPKDTIFNRKWYDMVQEVLPKYEDYEDDDKYEEICQKIKQELLNKHKNDNCIYLDENDSPIYDYDYPNLFSKNEIIEIRKNARNSLPL